MKTTRIEAIQASEKYFFTGLPCKYGHIDKRLASNHHCVVCLTKSTKRWQAKNKDRDLANRAAYSIKSKHKKAEYIKKWSLENKDKRRIYDATRRARLASSSGRLSLNIGAKVLSLQKYRCANCKTSLSDKKYHLDHIIPLAKFGLNIDSNIQILCSTCNHKKSSKDPIIWAQENGRLL
jgi:5-methylcytosine-specific restriction endonuclease McrA